MEAILPAFVVVLLFLLATLTPTQSFMAAQDQLETARQEMEARLRDRNRTDLALVDSGVTLDGVTVALTLTNTGHTKLADYEQWDMIVQYYDAGGDYHVTWVPFLEGASPALNTWSVVDISPDVFDPGILNPEETVVVEFKVFPAVGVGWTNRAALGPANGMGLTALFVRPPPPPTPTPTPTP